MCRRYPPYGIDEPRGEVEQGHVVIARNHEHRKAQLVEELPRRAELAAPRALGEVARDGDEGWSDRLDGVHQRVDDPRIDAAEVNVGEVRDGRHRIRAAGERPAALRDANDTAAACAESRPRRRSRRECIWLSACQSSSRLSR